MSIYKSKKPTRDGRQYFFRVRYKTLLGESKDYTSPKFKLKKDAEEEEIKYKANIGELINKSSDLTIKNIYEELLNEKSKQVKLQTFIKYDAKFSHLKDIENYKIKDLNVNIIKKLTNKLNSEKISVDYINKILGLLRQIIIYSARTYNTSENILKFITNVKSTSYEEKEMLFFTYDEYKNFDKVINEFEWHVFFEILYFLGLRQGECLALTWKDINFEKREISITKTLTSKIKGKEWYISTPKTKSSNRVLPLTDKLYCDLLKMRENALKYTDFSNSWFVFGCAIPFKETTIQKHKNKYCKKAEVKQIRIHDFRHSCASLLINKGASIVLVAKYLGHSDVKMTLNRYSHMYKSELESITSTLNDL